MQLFPAQALLVRKTFPKASKETKERRTQMQQTNILAQRSSLQPQQLAHLYSRVGIFAWLLVEQTPKSALSSTRQLGFASIFGKGSLSVPAGQVKTEMQKTFFIKKGESRG